MKPIHTPPSKAYLEARHKNAHTALKMCRQDDLRPYFEDSVAYWENRLMEIKT